MTNLIDLKIKVFQMKLYLMLVILLNYKVQASDKKVSNPNNICEDANSNLISGDPSLNKSTYVCTGANHLSEITDAIPRDVKELIINNSSILDKSSDDGDQKTFDSLQSINIIRSFVGSGFHQWISGLKSLENLSLHESANNYTLCHDNTNITVLELKVTSLKNLKNLKISNGNISNLVVENTTSMPYLDLSDNSIECGRDFTWLVKLYKSTKRVILNNTRCFMKKIFESRPFQMLYSLDSEPFIPIMEYRREATDNCPKNCICELKGVVSIDRPQLNVDCINASLTKLPDIIPRGSSRCNFSGNFIEDISPVYDNPLYDKVAMFSFSRNRISFLDPVKFPKWLSRRGDAGFYFDNNRLEKFPAESVKRVLDEFGKTQPYVPELLLSSNRWICSCDYISQFQDLLYDYQVDIKDANIVRCSVDDPYNPEIKILSLDVQSLCNKEPFLDNLDILNIFLVLLLLILILDFAYNYRQYRLTRKLPWIITKIKW